MIYAMSVKTTGMGRSLAGVGAKLAAGGVVCSVLCLPAEAVTCDHKIGLETKTADGRANYRSVKPGQTVCIEAGPRKKLILENFTGAEKQPITFVNHGGKVLLRGTPTKYGLIVRNTRHFRLTGTGVPSIKYGIVIDGGFDTGVRVGWRSSNLEIDHLEVVHLTGQGLSIKTHANCSDGSDNEFDYDGDGQTVGDLDDVVTKSNFVQRETILHDNYVHNVGDEAFYLGANRTVYATYGQGSRAGCSVSSERPLNPELHGVQIYANRVERTGRDAINVKGAAKGCVIHENRIFEDSIAGLEGGQDGGIMVDLNSRCDVYANLIRDSNGRGISLAGSGGRVFGNLIINPGRGFDPNERYATGIHVHMGTPGEPYEIYNNTIINPKSQGIRFTYRPGTGHRIVDNVIVSAGRSGGSAPVYVKDTSRVVVSNNVSLRTSALTSEPESSK